MNRNNLNWLISIIILLVFSLWIDLNNNISLLNPFSSSPLFDRNVELRLGLDLRGGLQTLLEADLPATASVSSGDLETTRQILENRANALGVSEVMMQTAGDRRIVAEFPGVSNPEEVVASLQQTGLLEFVDTGDYRPPIGSILLTDYTSGDTTTTTAPTLTPDATTPSPEVTPTADATTPSPEATPTADGTQQDTTVYHTIMTGKELDSISVAPGSLGGNYSIDFSLKPDGASIFGAHTAANVNKVLTITLMGASFQRQPSIPP